MPFTTHGICFNDWREVRVSLSNGEPIVPTALHKPCFPHWAAQICISKCLFLSSIFYYIDLFFCLCQHFSVLITMTPLSILISSEPICIHFQDVLVRHFLFQMNYQISLAHSKNSDASICMFIRICMCICICICISTCVCVYVSACVYMLLCVPMCLCLSVSMYLCL